MYNSLEGKPRRPKLDALSQDTCILADTSLLKTLIKRSNTSGGSLRECPVHRQMSGPTTGPSVHLGQSCIWDPRAAVQDAMGVWEVRCTNGCARLCQGMLHARGVW